MVTSTATIRLREQLPMKDLVVATHLLGKAATNLAFPTTTAKLDGEYRWDDVDTRKPSCASTRMVHDTSHTSCGSKTPRAQPAGKNVVPDLWDVGRRDDNVVFPVGNRVPSGRIEMMILRLPSALSASHSFSASQVKTCWIFLTRYVCAP